MDTAIKKFKRDSNTKQKLYYYPKEYMCTIGSLKGIFLPCISSKTISDILTSSLSLLPQLFLH